MKYRKLLFCLFAALLIIGAPAFLQAQVTVSTETEISGEEGETAVLPISVTNVTGENITGVEFAAAYDTTVMEITGYETEGTLVDVLTTFDFNTKDDTTYFAAFGSEALTGEGVLVNLEVTFKKSGSTSISFNDFYMNSTLYSVNNVDVSVGAVDIHINDIQGDTSEVYTVPVTVDDITGKEIQSYEFTLNFDETVINITDMSVEGTLSEGTTPDYTADNDNGKFYGGAFSDTFLSGEGVLFNLTIEMVGEGISNLDFDDTFTFNTGTPEAKANIGKAYVGMIDVILPTETVTVDDTTMLPIVIEKVGGQNFTAFQFDFDFEDEELEIIEIVQENTLTADWTVDETIKDGNCNVGGFSDTPLSGDDSVLVYLHVVGLQPSIADLTWNEFIFNADEVPTYQIDGSVTVLDHLAPYFTSVMPDTQISENQELSFHYMAADDNGDAVSFALVDTIEGITVETDGAFMWTPTYDQHGTYHVIVSVTDGMYTVKDTAMVTVDNAIPELTLAEAKIDENEDYVPDMLGDTVIVTGIVTTPNFSGSKYDFAFQDETAGMGFYGNSAVEINMYDEVKITGEIGQFNGKTQINPLSENDIEILSSDNDVTPVTITNIGAVDLEAHESMLVKILGAEILSPEYWPADGDDANLDFSVTNRDTISMRIDKETNLDGWEDHPGVWEGFSVIGVIDQYTFSDPANDGYQLKPRMQSDFDNFVGTENGPEVPETYSLNQNYPNPFNPTTTISYALPFNSEVKLTVYNMLGKKVAELVNSTQNAGIHATSWNAANMPSGIYFYNIKMQSIDGKESFNNVRKMMLVK